MALDLDVENNAPSTISAYIDSFVSSFGIMRWILFNLISDRGRRYMRLMLIYIVLNELVMFTPVASVPSWLRGMQSGDLVVSVAFISFAGFMLLIGNYLSKLNRIAWERSYGELRTEMSSRLTELFLSKSVGQYRQEGNYLSASNVEKARGRIWSLVESLVFGGIRSVFKLAVSFIGIFVFYPPAGVIAGVMLAAYLLTMVYMNKAIYEMIIPIEKRLNNHDRRRSDLWDLAEKAVNAAKVKEEVTALRDKMRNIVVDDFDVSAWYVSRTNWRGYAIILVWIFEMIFVTMSAIDGKLSPDAAVPVFFWSLDLFMNIWMLGELERSISWTLPTVGIMIKTLEVKNATPTVEGAVSVNGSGLLNIELDGVSYAYAGDDGSSETVVLKDINLTLRGGEKVGFVGLSGSGKSTLGYLLMRFMDPSAGRVLVNGVDLRDVDLDSYRRVTRHIAQEPQILDRTLRENVLYQITDCDVEKYSDDEIWKVLNSVELGKDGRFSDGLDTRIGRNGMKLSGGQRQRLMIASAIIEESRFLVVDEATSAMDSETEAKVQASIEKVLGLDTTAVVIAHRLSTLKFCDRIVVLRPLSEVKDGEEQIEYIASSFDDAYANSGTFRRFADLQRRLLEY